MSGRRNHYIPQSVLRGFATRRGKNDYVWQYRKGATTPINPNVLNVAVEGDFYRVDGDDRIDDALTQLENPYGVALFLLRSKGPGALGPDHLQTLKRVVANSFVRTARMRAVMGAAGQGAHEMMKRIAADQDLLVNAIGHAIQDEDRLLAMLKSEIVKQGKPVPSDDILRPLLRAQVARVTPTMRQSVGAMVERLKPIADAPSTREKFDARKMHLKAIESSGLEPSARIAQLKERPFGISAVNNGTLVLGDAVVLGVAVDGKTIVDALTPLDELSGWVMPVTSQLFVYSGPAELAHLDADAINHAGIGLSNRFFVAEYRDESLNSLRDEIGTIPTVIDQIDWRGLHEQLAQRARDGTLDL